VCSRKFISSHFSGTATDRKLEGTLTLTNNNNIVFSYNYIGLFEQCDISVWAVEEIDMTI